MTRPTVSRWLPVLASLACLAILVGCQQKSNEERFLESAPAGRAPGPGDPVGGGRNDGGMQAGYPGMEETRKTEPAAEADAPAEVPPPAEATTPATEPAAAEVEVSPTPTLEPPAVENPVAPPVEPPVAEEPAGGDTP